MAQEIIDIGTSSGSGNGEPLRVGGVKINNNFTELYEKAKNNTVYLSSELDLPNQTATTWTMDSNTPYKLIADFSTSKQCIPSLGSSLRGDNIGSYTLTYTGSLSMFKATDADFFISNIRIDAGVGNVAFEFSETTGNAHRFIADTVGVVNCAVWGKFTDMLLVEIDNSNGGSGGNALQGVQFFGTNTIISINRFALTSSNASFIGVNLGSSIVNIPEFSDLFITAPSGAYGFSGLIDSGNIPTGRLGSIRDCEFFGGMTDLQNISVQNDVRWDFRGNTPTANTFPDALMSFKGNALDTVISSVDTPVLVNASWVEVQSSMFSVSSAGRITFLKERDMRAPVTISIGLISTGGGAKTVTVYLAKNGVVIDESGFPVLISGSDASTLTIPWQVTMSKNDYIEVFVENNTNTTNIIAEHAIVRVL